MIKTKKELKEYLMADKNQLGISRKNPRPFVDHIWRYEICLRKYEYWINRKPNPITSIIKNIYKLKFYRKCIQLGVFIGPNTCGKGLCISHPNCIQVNWHAKIGENLRIQEGVTVGGDKGGVPTIGNNVFLGSGCKIIGDVHIPDRCVVGANAVVVHSIQEMGITVAGVPAKKISNQSSEEYIRDIGGSKCGD